jgi:Phage capsid family
MTNDLLSKIDRVRLEAALESDEPFAGDRIARVACYAAGQEFRRVALRLPSIREGAEPPQAIEPPTIENERFVADTSGAVAGVHVFPAIWTYARRRSLAFQLARMLPMAGPKVTAPSLTPAGLPAVRWQATEGVSVAKSDPVWEAAPVQVQAYTAIVWSIASGELIEDMAAPMTGDGVALLGQVFMDALLDEIDRVYLEGDSSVAGEKIDGVIKKAGATATAAASPKAALEALNPAAVATVVWVLTPEAADVFKTSNAMRPAEISALDSLSQLAEFPTIAGSINGRPAVIVPQEWLGAVKGVVGAFKRATVVGFRDPPSFDSTPDQPDAWMAGAYAVRAKARIGVGVVQPTMICTLT